MTKRNAFIFAILGFSFLIADDLVAQESEFEKWKNEQQKEFQVYKNEMDIEFAKLLENLWIELDINRSSILYERPKPELLPVFDGDLGVDEKVESISVVTNEKSDATNSENLSFSQTGTFNVPTSDFSLEHYVPPKTAAKAARASPTPRATSILSLGSFPKCSEPRTMWF